MPRRSRIYTNVGKYHVIIRGNNKQLLFIEREDYLFFLNRLKKYSTQMNIDIYAFCLMNNHVHLLIGNAFGINLGKFVQKITNSYVYFFNRKYDRSGHLFQGRYKSQPVENDLYFKTVFRYILKNSDTRTSGGYKNYLWNSYRAIIDKKNNSFVKTEYVKKIFGDETSLIRFLELDNKDKCMEYENKLTISDKKAIKMIKELFRISAPVNICSESISNQILKVQILKEKGLSINQISRLTSIAKKTIREA